MKVQINYIRPFSQYEGKEPVNNSFGFDYCRKLVAEGVDSKEPLEVYRGEKLAYTISSIGWGFTKKIREDDTASPCTVKHVPFIQFKTPLDDTTVNRTAV